MSNIRSEPRNETAFVYVSNAVDGNISTYMLHDDGRLTVRQTTQAAYLAMAMTVSADRSRLYLAIRAEPFALLTFSIDRHSGELRQIATCSVEDSHSFLSLDRSGRYLFAASYRSSCIRCFAISADGAIDPVPTDTHSDIAQAHAIRVDASNRFAYVPSLGADAIHQFRFDVLAGRLVPLDPPQVRVPARFGPRHFVLSNDNQFMHVVNEMQASVTTFRRDEISGLLEVQGTVSGLTADSRLVAGAPPSITSHPSSALKDSFEHGEHEAPLNVRAADIQATPDDRFLYISERAGQTIASFKRDDVTGTLSYTGSTDVAKRPRGFAIDPSGRYLIASAEVEATLTVYGIDTTDGRLTQMGTYPAGRGANWVEIVAR